jgi:hypothetical protein
MKLGQIDGVLPRTINSGTRSWLDWGGWTSSGCHRSLGSIVVILMTSTLAALVYSETVISSVNPFWSSNSKRCLGKRLDGVSLACCKESDQKVPGDEDLATTDRVVERDDDDVCE